MTSSQLGGIAANWNCSNPNDEVLTTTCPRLRSRKNARLRPLETATAETNGFIVNRHGRLSLPDVDPVHDLRQVETSRCVPKSAVRNTLIADNCGCEKTDYELTFRLPVDPRGGEADLRFELSDDRRPVRSFCEWNWSDHSGVAVVHGGTPRMRSPLSGPIATLFMFVPLVAIPLLAVFGMPQFSTLSPPAQVEELKFASDKEKPAPKVSQPEGELAGGVQVTESGTASQPATGTSSRPVNDTDPFAEFARAPEGDAAQPQQQESRPAKSLADNRDRGARKTSAALADRRDQHVDTERFRRGGGTRFRRGKNRENRSRPGSCRSEQSNSDGTEEIESRNADDGRL